MLAAPVSAIALTVLLRLGLYVWLHRAGYFFGIPWDSFARTQLAYAWAQQPYFSAGTGYWLPLQFWLVGSVYVLINPWVHGSEILVPVFVNNVFLIGSLAVTYAIGWRLGGATAGFIACMLAGLYSGDVFVSYSALSEPMQIFFILLTSYYVHDLFESGAAARGRLALKAAVSAFLGAATHHVGWFLCLFVVLCVAPLCISSLRERDWRTLTYGVSALGLCALTPLVWLSNSYRLHGNFLYAVQFAQSQQAAYIGQKTLPSRVVIPAQVLLSTFPAITVLGLIALVIVAIKRRRALFYVATPAFVLACIWMTTAMAFTAPYQEPRYLVFWGWATMPCIAFAVVYLWRQPGMLSKAAVGVALVLLLAGNLIDLRSFENSFGPDVIETARQAKAFLRLHRARGAILIENTSFAERGVIPVIAGAPERFMLAEGSALNDRYRVLSDSTGPWLAIVRTEKLAGESRDRGRYVRRIGAYYLISSEPP